MLNTSESKKSENSNDPNVIQLGFNISVSGKSASDIEVFVNDKKDGYKHLSSKRKVKEIKTHSNVSEDETPVCTQQSDLKTTGRSSSVSDTNERDGKRSTPRTAGAKCMSPSSCNISTDRQSEDLTIIDEIKNAIGNFDRFSEHVREIPRLTTNHIYTSTPKPDEKNSRSEGNLSVIPRSYVAKYDFRDGKYYRKTRPSCSDLFLKPLPAEDYFKKSYIRRYSNLESSYHYTSVDNIPQHYGSEYKVRGDCRGVAKSDNEKSDVMSSSSEACTSEPPPCRRGGSSELLDKQSTSSESAKDIKIYQSGGVIIMQNFKENPPDGVDAKDLVNASKIMEDCDKLLRDKIENSSVESRKPLTNNSSSDVDVKEQPGRLVHFDLPSCDSAKSKSCESLTEMNKSDDNRPFRNGTIAWKCDFPRSKDGSLPIPQTQDFTSLSTQENDSIISNLLGMSPTSSTCEKKLEWDSGADVGYLNVDLTKENISTIERIILKGLSNDGKSNKEMVYRKSSGDKGQHSGQFVLERTPPDVDIGWMQRGSSSKESPDSGERRSKEVVVRVKSDEKGSRSGKNKRSHVEVTFGGDPSSVGVTLKPEDVQVKHEGTKPSAKPRITKQGKPPVQKKKSSQQAVGTNVDEKVPQPRHLDKETPPTTSDKCTFTNTLFCNDYSFELPLGNISRSEESGRSESSDKRPANASPRTKKLTKRKCVTQGGDKPKVDNIIETMKKPTKETSSNVGDEKSETEDVGTVDRSERRDAKTDTPSSGKHKGAQSRPISASSSSIRTVMPNREVWPEPETKNYLDQIIQTTQLECESKAIQAFLSAKCSAASTRVEEGNSSTHSNASGDQVPKKDITSKFILSCSKSVQAAGMNSSLPKHLGHPKEAELHPQHNSKSTQVFGGSVTSLPNYHSNVVGKETISMERVNVLNDKVRSVVTMQNERNAGTGKRQETPVEIVVSENSLKSGRHLKKRKSSYNGEDKENVSVDEEEPNAEEVSRQDTELSAKNESRKSDSLAFGSCDVQVSDGGKSVFLTSERLKEHGESIDRNIIQEKYFESQLREMERREMVSRSTSMEKRIGSERVTQTSHSLKTGVSVSCQYSPVSASEEQVSTPATYGNSRGEDTTTRGDEEDYYRESNQASDIGKDVGDSLSSDTQTAHSWVEGMQQNAPSTNCIVGRALSFEYLPGHIYEDPANLRDDSPSKRVGNINLCEVADVDSSSRSENQAKEPESPHTVVLENTDRTADESDHMKNLDSNLAELQSVVSRLHEKEAIFQRITNSVLTTVTKANGSGDSPRLEADESRGSKQSDERNGNPVMGDGAQRTSPCPEPRRKPDVNQETACQTDSLTPKPVELSEEVNKLEVRISEEKQQQIEWIEKEINHLVMLRRLLEKEEDKSLSGQKRKRHHYLTEAKESDSLSETLKKDVIKNPLSDCSLPKPVSDPTTVDNLKTKTPSPTKDEKSPMDSLQKIIESPNGAAPHFGMSLSLRRTKKVQQVTMLPVGVQVTLRQRKNSVDGCSATREKKHDSSMQYTLRNDGRESKNRCKCMKCNQGKCNCLKSSSEHVGRKRPADDRKSMAYADSADVSRSVCDEDKDVKIPEFSINTSEGVSSIDSADLTLSSVLDQNSNDSSNAFDKCACGCHAEPLPRCNSCHLLNTCKKCRCYKRIVCCHCDNDAPAKEPPKSRSGCRCSQPQISRECSLCSCHVQRLPPTCKCKKVYQERSCQTEGKECKCCDCSAAKDAPGLYRETKHMVEKTQVTENREGIDVAYPSEKKYEEEARKSIDERYPYQIKVPLESKSEENPKDAAVIKNEVEKRCPCQTEQVGVKELKGKTRCTCRNRTGRRKSEDDHPRHYFLQVEETTEEEEEEEGSSLPCDNRNSLQVITIRVPVRKVCAKSGNVPQGAYKIAKAGWKPRTERETGDSQKAPECKCCADCPGKRKATLPERPRTVASSRPSRADDEDQCKCCPDCLGHDKFERSERQDFASCDEYERRKLATLPLTGKSTERSRGACQCCNCKVPTLERGKQESVLRPERLATDGDSGECERRAPSVHGNAFEDETEESSRREPCLSNREKENRRIKKSKERNGCDKSKKESSRKFTSVGRPCGGAPARDNNSKSCDYYNFNKKEFMTKSELEREERKKKATKLTLQECLTVKRPDLYSRAECRRKIISEKSRDRTDRHAKKMECLTKLLPRCEVPRNDAELKLFTSAQMKRQTRKYLKNLPEVAMRENEEKKRMQYQTNKLMAEIFAKKLQLQTLRGRLNLSNSFTVMSTM